MVRHILPLTLFVLLGVGCASKTDSPELSGYYQASFGGAYQFKNASWVTVSPDGSKVYVLQRGWPAVSVWTLDGQLISTWRTEALGDPHSLKFQTMPSGATYIWITDMAPPLTAGSGYGHCLKQFDLDGNYLKSIGTCGEDSQGRGLYPVQFDKVTDVAFDVSGFLWVTDGDINGLNNRVLQLDQSGNVIQVWSAPGDQRGSGIKEFNLPHAIDVDSCNRVWVADALNRRVQVISTSGEFLQQLQCFGTDGVYGLSVSQSDLGTTQLYTTSSPTNSPTGGTVRIFDVATSCSALPVPNGCTPRYEWDISLPVGSSERMLHAVDAISSGDTLYIAPLGGDLAPQRWEKIQQD